MTGSDNTVEVMPLLYIGWASRDRASRLFPTRRGGFLPQSLVRLCLNAMTSDHSDIKLPRTPSPAAQGTAIHGVQAQESTNVADARSLASIELPTTNVVPPGRAEKTYHPFSLSVIAPLMPASVFGLLARLGLDALTTYDGRSIFPLAYPQALGCLIMGICLPLKDPISS